MPVRDYGGAGAARYPAGGSPARMSQTAPPVTRSPKDVYQREVQKAWQNYQPLPTPIFSPSYFTPTGLINQLNQTFQAQPQINTQQLQQQAQSQASLLTNPQIEALRQQIQSFQSLIPQAQETVNTAYRDANRQIGQLGQQVVSQMLEQLSREPGGIRTGVPYELSRRMQEAITPLSDSLEVARQSQLDQVIGALEVEKQNAQNLLDTIQRNRENMETMQYNALYDQAVERFRAAQNQQLQYLSSLIGMEMDARAGAAQAQQASVEQYNQFLQNLLTLQLEEAERARARQLESNISAWQNFIFSPDTRTPIDALRKLESNRTNIIEDIGVDAYQELYNQISRMDLTATLPTYLPSYGSTPSTLPAPSPTTAAPRTLPQQGGSSSFWSPVFSLPVLLGLFGGR